MDRGISGRLHRALAPCLFASGLAASSTVQAQAASDAASVPASAPADVSGRLPSVVVTAQKRAEPAQSVPISMTAIGEQSLERLGLRSLADLARQVPSLSIVSAGPGQNVLIIRGVSSTAGNAGTVGYYLDDTPISASSNAALLANRGVIDPAVFDLARIEVLRGPQGTLYGSSSMGGTIKYVTNQPDASAFGGKATVSFSGTQGGGLNRGANGVVNVPLITDVLAARVAVFYRRDDGFIDRYPIAKTNLLGIEPGGAAQKDVNTELTTGTRVQLKWDLPGRLSITPSILYQETSLGAPYQIDVPPGSLDNLIQTRLVPEPSQQRSTVSNLAIRKTFDEGELLSSTSYYDRKVSLNEDTSKVLAFFFGPVPQSYVYPASMHGEYVNHEFTQEFRFVSSFSGPLQVIGGLFYHHVNAPLQSEIPVPAGYNDAFGTNFGSFFEGARQAQLSEKAAFGEASYEIVPRLTGRVGLRVFRVSQTFAQQGDGVFNGGPTAVVGDSSDKGVNPKFNLSWQVDDDRLVYTTVSKGYRPGGPNNPAPANVCGAEVAKLGLSESALTQFGADSLWNYEAGAKTAWLDQRLQVNGALYYIDWSKVQQQIVLQCGFNITANFGKAVSRGGELEVNWRATKNLLLAAGLGYTDARLKNDVPGTAAKDGDRLLDVPRWTASTSAELTVPLADERSGYGRVDVSYSGDANTLYDRTSPFYKRGGYTLTNLKFGIDSGAQTFGSWRAELFVDNVFDRIGETSLPVAISADLPTTRRLAVTRPRTAGVTLSFAY